MYIRSVLATACLTIFGLAACGAPDCTETCEHIITDLACNATRIDFASADACENQCKTGEPVWDTGFRDCVAEAATCDEIVACDK